MTSTIAFEQHAWDQLAGALDMDVESAWVLLARHIQIDSFTDHTFLVCEAIAVPDSGYTLRGGDRLTLNPDAWYPAFLRAEAEDLVPIFVHTHPRMAPRHSDLDLDLDTELARVAGARLTRGSYGSLVIGNTREHPEFAARFTTDAETWLRVDRVRIVGERLTLLTHDNAIAPGIFNRQVLAFGEEGQRALKHLRVGVIGAGGTGSAAIEQLVRLGIEDIVVIDPQELADTNVTRVYGSELGMVGISKVEVAEASSTRIGLGASVTPVHGSLLKRSVAETLVHCDVILGCTDDHASRLVATRLPQAFLLHLIDCGVVIDSRSGALFDILARVTVVTPTSACLMCTGDIDPTQAALEALPVEEQAERIREGYAPGLDHTDPSVITYTTMTASLAVNELLSRLFGYCEDAPANKLTARIANRDFSRTRYAPRDAHRCNRRELIGAGLREPFLDYGWANE